MFMRRFLKWWQDKSVKGTGKELQHHIDTYKVYTLAQYKKIVCQQGGVDKSTLMRDKDEQKEFFQECQKSSFEEQQTHIREHVIRELLTIFSIFHQAAPLKVPKNADELFDKVVEARDTDTFPVHAPSICIPRVFINITKSRVEAIFRRLDFGELERVDMITKENANGDKYQRVFVHFKKWADNEDASTARQMLLSDQEVKVVYDDPWFWKLSASKSLRPEDRPQRRRRPTPFVDFKQSSKSQSTHQMKSNSEPMEPSNTIPQFVNAQQTVEPSKASIKNFNKMNKALMKKLGYSLHVQQSEIPNAGPGLFLEGSAVAGTVICMYPGIVYLKEYVVSGDTDGMFGPDDSGTYTMGRYDGSIFNGDCEPQWHPSPVSYGHLIRHPTGILPLTEDHRGLPRVLGKPNVMSCPFNYPELDSGSSKTQRSIFSRLKDAPDEKQATPTAANVDIEKYLDKGTIGKKFPKEFQAYIPNTYYKPPVLLSTQEAKESYTFGIALIATENIKDEEIYLDYRYNPHLETPSWYKTIDEETAQRRWKDHHTYANQ
eukprot:g6705.t1